MNTMNKKEWQDEAYRAVTGLAYASFILDKPFTSNDVWEVLKELAPDAVPADGRWLGPVIQRAARDGLIRKVGSGVLSERGHGSRMNSAWMGAL